MYDKIHYNKKIIIIKKKESRGTYTQWNITQLLKKLIWFRSNEADETGAYYTE